MNKTSLALLLAFGLSLSAAAHADEPDEHFLLTPALVQKVKNANLALKKLKQSQDDAGDDEDEKKPDHARRKDGMLPVEDAARALEAQPAAKAALAKEGLSPREFAIAYYAELHAAVYLATEAMAKKGAASQAGFTREQQANVALLRKLGPAVYGTR